MYYESLASERAKKKTEFYLALWTNISQLLLALGKSCLLF